MLVVRKRAFFKIAQDAREYRQDFVPTSVFLTKLADRGVDIFTFIERKWCFNIPNPKDSWVKEDMTMSHFFKLNTYDELVERHRQENA